MKRFLKKWFHLYKYKSVSKETPIHILEDCVSQLAALYSYANGKDYRESQRDILNLRLAELKHTVLEQFRYLQC